MGRCEAMIALRVELVSVDEDVLEELVSVAVDDADPDEVTPSPGTRLGPCSGGLAA